MSKREFCHPSEPKRKNLRKTKEIQILGLFRELKKTMEHEGDGDTSYNWCTGNDSQRLGKETRRGGNQKTSRDHQNYSITEIGQNIEKSSGDLSRLAVT